MHLLNGSDALIGQDALQKQDDERASQKLKRFQNKKDILTLAASYLSYLIQYNVK